MNIMKEHTDKAKELIKVFGDKATAFCLQHLQECQYREGTFGYDYWVNVMWEIDKLKKMSQI